MIKFFFGVMLKISHKMLTIIFGEDIDLFYAGELGKLAEIDYFGKGKPLSAVIITPDDSGKFVVGYYSNEELDHSYNMYRE